MCSILYTVFNGTSAGPAAILCAGLVVSSWIAYEIFESPERCMMNEVACYLYAYRARWLATGSAKGSGSKWNSTAGQYIIKRNVCTWNLHAFSRCGQGCLTGFGGGGGSENGGEGGIKRQVGVGEERMFCWMSGEQAKGGCRFLLNQFYFHTGWSVSFNHFTAAGKWKVPGLISQLELTEQNPPPRSAGNGAKSTLSLWITTA